jgi:outer membrane protein
LIGATRAARRAAADNLRNLEVKERSGQALTPEFIDQKLRSQDRVADAEMQEIQALTQYNASIAKLYQTMGTLLEHNKIELKPDPTGN